MDHECKIKQVKEINFCHVHNVHRFTVLKSYCVLCENELVPVVTVINKCGCYESNE